VNAPRAVREREKANEQTVAAPCTDIGGARLTGFGSTACQEVVNSAPLERRPSQGDEQKAHGHRANDIDHQCPRAHAFLLRRAADNPTIVNPNFIHK
jgi:hypothetical protein